MVSTGKHFRHRVIDGLRAPERVWAATYPVLGQDPHQFAAWNASDRKLVYWTAVKTGFRQNELRTLRVRNVLFDAHPVQIVIEAGNAKNRTRGSVPIPDDLASKLRKYIKGRDDDDKLFPFPTTNHGIVDMFRRDLDGAGIKWDYGKDNPETVDFQTLRSTSTGHAFDLEGVSFQSTRPRGARPACRDLLFRWLSTGNHLWGAVWGAPCAGCRIQAHQREHGRREANSLKRGEKRPEAAISACRRLSSPREG